MTQEYKKKIDNLLMDMLSNVTLREDEKHGIEQELRGVIQKEFFYRLVVSLPAEESQKIQQCIQEKGMNDGQTHEEVARACLRAYSHEHMLATLDQAMTQIVMTYTNITMRALDNEQRAAVEDFQKNLLLSQAA